SCCCRLAQPHPAELVFLDDRVAAHARILGNARLPGDGNAMPRAVEDEPVIAALEAGLGDRSEMQRRRTMATAVGKGCRAVLVVTKQHDRLVADAAGDGLRPEFVRPRGHVPSVTEPPPPAPLRR